MGITPRKSWTDWKMFDFPGINTADNPIFTIFIMKNEVTFALQMADFCEWLSLFQLEFAYQYLQIKILREKQNTNS